MASVLVECTVRPRGPELPAEFECVRVTAQDVSVLLVVPAEDVVTVVGKSYVRMQLDESADPPVRVFVDVEESLQLTHVRPAWSSDVTGRRAVLVMPPGQVHADTSRREGK